MPGCFAGGFRDGAHCTLSQIENFLQLMLFKITYDSLCVKGEPQDENIARIANAVQCHN